MKRMKQKLNSQTGASITFALLLFLVCAVVGAAVLTAGSAAAGRISKTAEMDQRYYSVNSAAGLLIEKIEEETVTVVKTVKTGSGSDYTSYTCCVEGEEPFAVDQVTVLQFPSIPAEAAYALAAGTESGTRTPVLTAAETDAGGSGLQNREGSGKYRLVLVFSADLSRRTDQTGDNESTVTTRVSWHLTDLRTDFAGRRGGTT